MTRVYSSEWLDERRNVLRFQCIVTNRGVLLYQVAIIVEDEQVLDIHTVVFTFEASVGIAHDVTSCINRACAVARGLVTCDTFNEVSPLMFD